MAQAAAYDPSDVITTTEYYVKTTGDPFFIPGNCQSPATSHDNPDNGTKAERLAACQLLAPNGSEVVAWWLKHLTLVNYHHVLLQVVPVVM